LKALISDIHGNLEALTQVMKDIRKQHVSEIYFLGDVVGYGPDPEKCIDIAGRNAKVRLMGNHDFAMLTAPVGFNPIAAGAIACLRARMEPGTYSMPWKRKRWEFLGSLNIAHREKRKLFVHASPRDPIMEYVLPSDPEYNPAKIADVFERVEELCFVGHTHFPGVITPEPKFQTLQELDYHFTLNGEKAIINIGSVGQPRDKDPRACYALMGDKEVIWRRVEYDYEKTIAKVKKLTCLDPRVGMRLAEGR